MHQAVGRDYVQSLSLAIERGRGKGAHTLRYHAFGNVLGSNLGDTFISQQMKTEAR